MLFFINFDKEYLYSELQNWAKSALGSYCCAVVANSVRIFRIYLTGLKEEEWMALVGFTCRNKQRYSTIPTP